MHYLKKQSQQSSLQTYETILVAGNAKEPEVPRLMLI